MICEMKDKKERKQFGSDKQTHDESVDFERAMLLTGNGRYHLLLILVCGFTTMATGFQNGITAYILPSAQCDLELSSREMGLLNAAFMIGGATSAMIWGAIADVIGRKKILIWTLVANGAFTILSSFSQNFPVFFGFRLLNGFVIGAPATIILTYLGEFHSENTRARAICYQGFFWTVSWILLPVLAWIIIPLDFVLLFHGFKFNSWRLFVSIFGLPSLICGILLSKYPETPKFLMCQGRNKEALEIMREIFVSNNQQEMEQYPVISLTPATSESMKKADSLASDLGRMWKQFCQLLCPPFLKYTVLCSVITFTNMFGYYGLGLWLPELFNRFETYYNSHPNMTITVCELTSPRLGNTTFFAGEFASQLNVTSHLTSHSSSLPTNMTATYQGNDETCNSSVNPKVFVNTITMGVSCLVGNFASSYLANRLDRRVMPVVMMLIPGICGCSIYFLQTAAQNLVVACIFSSFISTANMVICSVIVDIFPTNVNAIAICASSFAGRFGAIVSNLLFGLLLDINCAVPIFLVGGVVIFGGTMGFFLPKNVIGRPATNDAENKLSVLE